MQVLQLVIRLDRLERLDKRSRTRRRVTVCDALNASAMIRFHRNDETIVADRHELILNGLSRSTHQSFERARDARTQHVDLVTNVRQFGTRAVVEFSAG